MAFIKIKKCLNCGVAHEWEFEGPTLKELRTIKKLTGLNGMGFAEAAEESDPDALAALLYILHRRDKINVPFDDVDLDFGDFEMEETEAEQEEREAVEKEESEPKKESRPRKNGPTKKEG